MTRTYDMTDRKTHICPACNRRTKAPLPQLFTLGHAAKMLRITLPMILLVVARADLDVVRIDGLLFVRDDEIERYRELRR